MERKIEWTHINIASRDNEPLNFDLVYLLLADSYPDETENYGVAIGKKFDSALYEEQHPYSEYDCVPHITYSFDKIREILKLLTDYNVTPMSLREVLDNMTLC